MLPLFVAAFRSNSTTNDMTICCLIVNKPKIPIPYWEKIIAYTVAENRSQIGTNVNGRHPKKPRFWKEKGRALWLEVEEVQIQGHHECMVRPDA